MPGPLQKVDSIITYLLAAPNVAQPGAGRRIEDLLIVAEVVAVGVGGFAGGGAVVGALDVEDDGVGEGERREGEEREELHVCDDDACDWVCGF